MNIPVKCGDPRFIDVAPGYYRPEFDDEGSRVDAVRCLQRAIDLKPDYSEAIQALSVTEGKASSEPPPPTSDDSAPVVEATSDEPKPTGERNDPGDGFGAAPVGYVWGGLF